MDDMESLKADIKKAAAKATQAKMDLHDLSEELPIGWEQAVAVAERTRDAYAALETLRAKLKSLEAAA